MANGPNFNGQEIRSSTNYYGEGMSNSRTLMRRHLFNIVYAMLLLAPLVTSSNSPNSSVPEKCSSHFSPVTASDAIQLECPSQNSFLNFTDDPRHANVWSLQLDCKGKDGAMDELAQQQKVLDKLINAQQFGTLKTLSLLNCGPSSARFLRLFQLDQLNFGGLTELDRLEWQSIGSTHLRSLRISRLSAVGGCKECRNGWLMERQSVLWPKNAIFPRLPQHIAITAPLPPNCSFSHCPKESAKFGQKVIHSQLGSSLQLRCHFQTHNAFVAKNGSANDQKIFVWPFSDDENEMRWEERPAILGNEVELVINSLNSHHLGFVACRCWHCNSPRFDLAEIRFWTPLSVSTNVAVYDKSAVGQSHIFLIVRGYPLERLRLAVRMVPNNLTEWHEFPAEQSTQQTFFNDSLLIRHELAHSYFFLRYFSIGIHECSDCWHSQEGGTFEVELCREGENESGQTLLANCAEAVLVQLRPTKHPISNGTKIAILSSAIHLNAFHLSSILLLLFILIALSSVPIVALAKAKLKMDRMKRGGGWQMSGNTQFTDEMHIPLYNLSHCDPTSNGHNLLVIDSQSLQLNKQIGKGAFGKVYEAIWLQKALKMATKCEKVEEETEQQQLETGKMEEFPKHSKGIGHKNDALKVAVKFLTNLNIDAEMEKEAALLAQLDHPNVLRMFGISYWKGQLTLVLELMNFGNLRNYLHDRSPPHSELYAQFPPALTNLELISISIQVAEGFCYIVQQQIVHRDIAARNCLVSGESDLRCKSAASRPPICVKISDFGMSRCLHSSMDYYKVRNKSAAVPIRWTAPECLNNGKYTHQSDIWSFGVLLFEVFSYGEMPFGAHLPNDKVSSALKSGATPKVPKRCSAELAELMRKCWDQMAGKRISAEEALRRLKEICWTERLKLEEERD